MLSVKQLLYWTKLHRRDIVRNARSVGVRFGSVESVEKDGIEYRHVQARCIGDSGPKKVDIFLTGKGATSKCIVSCSCEYFKYHCEVANARKESADVIYSNGKYPRETNPRGVSHLCKHLVACFTKGAHDLKPRKSRKPKRESAVDRIRKKRRKRKLKK